MLDDMIHYMDKILESATMALPLFRSEAQFKIVGELFGVPSSAEHTIGELAQRTGTPQATVSREVARLAEAGLLRRREEGNRTLVSANHDAAIAPELRSMMLKLYGPVAAIREGLASVAGVDRAVIFGSFASRWSGEPGPVPRDVDLLVIGDVHPDEIWTLTARLSRDLGIEVNPVMRTAEEWEHDTSGFAEAVRESPQLDVTPTERVVEPMP